MVHGPDTGFLVAAEVVEHADHAAAREVDHVFPNEAATQQFLAWLAQFSLGRKRLLDTLLAATYYQVGIQSVFTPNSADFAAFGIFICITPGATESRP